MKGTLVCLAFMAQGGNYSCTYIAWRWGYFIRYVVVVKKQPLRITTRSVPVAPSHCNSHTGYRRRLRSPSASHYNTIALTLQIFDEPYCSIWLWSSSPQDLHAHTPLAQIASFDFNKPELVMSCTYTSSMQLASCLSLSLSQPPPPLSVSTIEGAQLARNQ